MGMGGVRQTAATNGRALVLMYRAVHEALVTPSQKIYSSEAY